jgi:hypothetical protein
VDNKQTNIAQIQKYLKGELDAKAMHQLEREAQHDPFLMDALEGYTLSGKDQQGNLNNVAERLNERISRKEGRVIPWRTFAIAATILGFMVVVGLLIKNKEPQLAPQTAQLQPAKSKDTVSIQRENIAPVIEGKRSLQAVVKPDQEVIQPPLASRSSKQRAAANNTIAAVPAAVPSVAEAQADKEPVALEDRVMDVIAKQSDDTASPPAYVAVKKPALNQTSLAGKAKGVTTTPNPGKPDYNSTYYKPATDVQRLAGQVVSRTDGSPLPGVTVQVVGKAVGTQTDANGKFVLPGVKESETLAFGYVGFDSKKLRVNPQDSLKVELDQSSSSLSEVVVTRSNTPAKAHPRNGWETFKKYLQQGAVLPAGAKAGKVNLTFTVNTDGSVSNIKVVKNLSPVADLQAINLIRNGPAWVANTNGKPEKVSLQIKFVNAK